jgi:hypothetical protein
MAAKRANHARASPPHRRGGRRCCRVRGRKRRSHRRKGEEVVAGCTPTVVPWIQLGMPPHPGCATSMRWREIEVGPPPPPGRQGRRGAVEEEGAAGRRRRGGGGKVGFGRGRWGAPAIYVTDLGLLGQIGHGLCQHIMPPLLGKDLKTGSQPPLVPGVEPILPH